MADPEHVPAGRYGRTGLVALGLWSSVESRVARADNVRAALAFVARGECPLGVVYATDARSEPKVRIVSTFPPGSHPPVVYPTALTRNARPEARRFWAFLVSPAARPAFEKHGFEWLN
jgi:molybdate transport system substrate-binding protein